VSRTWGGQRVWKHATGFAGVHTLNAGLNLIYTLAQTMVFARVLDHRVYALTIVTQMFGFYLLPLNQSVARANFVVLRERLVRAGDHHAPEAAVAFNINQTLMLAVSLLAPMAMGMSNSIEYLSFFCLMIFNYTTNMWYFEIQMSLMAIDRALIYETISLFRRILTCILLIFLYISKEFVVYCLIMAAINVIFHLFITRKVAKASGIFAWPTDVTALGLKHHLGRLWVSLQATLAEWLTMNGPYALFSVRFGVGAGLVSIDAMQKLLRMVLTATRTLAEVSLPRVSKAILTGERRSGRLPALFALLGGGVGALSVGAVVATWEHWSFGLLLGPNNVAPHGAGGPAALALVAGAGIATGGHFIGHSGDHRAAPLLSAAAIIAVGLLSAYVLIERPQIVGALWATAICMATISIAALALLARLLRD
jgi:hypothetical protein